ncbi:hypothetical protein [Rhodococcus sp. B50]|uniref:hypothetical protein n=1 Tax=Rhodococcus sp. B50 TaxID=2682847 RepID=UPI001BD22A79|nr:hypothetical protein [Rhodococcus sp. B50]MBS9373619.1 hypothetical protein [Rhodococcus sp. B50]
MNAYDSLIDMKRSAALLLVHHHYGSLVAAIEHDDAYDDDDFEDSGEMAHAVRYERIVSTAEAEGKLTVLLNTLIESIAESMSPAQYAALVENVRAAAFADPDIALDGLFGRRPGTTEQLDTDL